MVALPIINPKQNSITMNYENYETYWYKYEKNGKQYKVSNFYVETTTYNAHMVHLTFEQALQRNPSELIK